MKRNSFFIILAGACVLSLAFALTFIYSRPEKSPYAAVHLPKGKIQVTIADTPALTQKGLGDRPSMPADQGMLFVFGNPGKYGFWMKDMLFPIDIVWIDEDFTVVAIDSNVATSTYPQAFLPPVPITYVLEMNAGYAEKYGVKNGVKIKGITSPLI